MSEEIKTRANQREAPAELQLIVMSGSGSQRIPLPRGGTVTLGRGDAATVKIDDDSISHAHAALHVRNTIQLEDLGSSNGTFLHGARLEAGRCVDVAAGEFFELGAVVCVVRGIDSHERLRQLRTHEHFLRSLRIRRARRLCRRPEWVLRHASGVRDEPFVSRTTTDLTALFVVDNLVFMAGVDGTLDVLVFHR